MPLQPETVVGATRLLIIFAMIFLEFTVPLGYERMVVTSLSTRAPVRVALPVACVAVRRVQNTHTVRTAAPAPLAGIALPA